MKTRRTSTRVLRGAVAVVGMITLLTGCLSPQQSTGLALLNADRVANGRSALIPDGYLQAKAQAWADRLASQNTLYHSSLPDGVPGCWTGLGENVGYGGSIDQVENAYMHSPPHKRNILDPTFTKGAVGVATNGNRVFTVEEFMAGC